MLRYLTAGESHGDCLLAILEGMPSGLAVRENDIDLQLQRRQCGYGRGQRMKIEKDRVQILSGLRMKKTIGSPIAMLIENKDKSIDRLASVTRPRPGHADLAGALKYNETDIRNILERASARETAARVAVGSVCRILLAQFGIDIFSHVISIGGIDAHVGQMALSAIKAKSSRSVLSCADFEAQKLMIERIDSIRKRGDSLGGAFEVIAAKVPVGLGSHVHYDKKLDARLAGALVSVQGVKAVEIGSGIEGSRWMGSRFHDEIFYKKGVGFYRNTNNAGGIEGGISNGEAIIIKGYMKPISTLGAPLSSVDIKTKKPYKATVQRHDICAVAACGVVAEAVVAFELAKAFKEKFGGDSLSEMKRNYTGYIKTIK